jgi:hypothetical protein
MTRFAIKLLLIVVSSVYAAHEAGWDVGRWGIYFTVLFNDEYEEYDTYSVWRGDGVEYYIIRFDTSDPADARSAHMNSANLTADDIVAEEELDDELTYSNFVEGLETDYLYGDGKYRELVWYLSDDELCFAFIFSCPADEWAEKDFYREDFFASIGTY